MIMYNPGAGVGPPAAAAAAAAAPAARAAAAVAAPQEAPLLGGACALLNDDPADVRDTNLFFFHRHMEAGRAAVLGNFKRVQGISEAIHGKVERHRLQRHDGSVDQSSYVVKNMPKDPSRTKPGLRAFYHRQYRHRRPDPNGRRECGVEDPWNEIGVLQYLASRPHCDSILRIVDYYDEPLTMALVTEDCRGGELFAVVSSQPHLFTQDIVQRCLHQIFGAIGHLHENDVGHRDISLENILLLERLPPPGGAFTTVTPKVMDFGQAVRCRTSDGRPFRYFGMAGKPYYRDPASYIPVDPRTKIPLGQVTLARPLGNEGGVVQAPSAGFAEVILDDGEPGSMCVLDLAGYRVDRFDAFSAGVVAFILAFGVPPWKEATNNDRGFMYVRSHGITGMIDSWRKPRLPSDAMQCIQGLLSVDPALRPTMQDAIACPWILAGAPPQVDAGGGGPGGGGPGGGGPGAPREAPRGGRLGSNASGYPEAGDRMPPTAFGVTISTAANVAAAVAAAAAGHGSGGTADGAAPPG